jgi:hypothetical protein
MLRLTTNRDGSTTVRNIETGEEHKADLAEFSKTGTFVPIRSVRREPERILVFFGFATMLMAVLLLVLAFATDYKRYRIHRLVSSSIKDTKPCVGADGPPALRFINRRASPQHNTTLGVYGRIQMKQLLAGVVALAAVVVPISGVTSPGDREQREAQVIAHARRADVHDLDVSLRSQTLDSWLARVVGSRGSIRWEANDCGEQTGNPANTPVDFPICAEAVIALSDGRAAGLSLAVGTAEKGVYGQPAVWHMYVTGRDKAFQHPRQLREFSRLIEADKPDPAL